MAAVLRNFSFLLKQKEKLAFSLEFGMYFCCTSVLLSLSTCVIFYASEGQQI